MSRFPQLFPSIVAGALLLLAGALVAKPDKGPRPSFTAVLAAEGGDPVVEKTLARKLEARAKALGFRITIDRGAKDDLRLAVSLNSDRIAQARAQLDRLIAAPQLDLRTVHPKSDLLAIKVRDGQEILPGYSYFAHRFLDDDGDPITKHLLLNKRATLNAEHVKRAWPDPARAGVINVELTGEGGARLKKITRPMQKGVDRIAVVLNGNVVSAPVVQDTISTNFIIQGVQDNDEREALVAALGEPLGATLKVVSLRAAAKPAP